MKNILYLFLIVFLALTIGFFWGSHWKQNLWLATENGKAQVKLNRLLNYISENYVDNVDMDSLTTNIIQDIIRQLDPHTVFIPRQARQAMLEDMQGNFVGIGVSFFMVEDTVAVVRVLEGGPSEKLGILPGDRILVADSDTLYQKGLDSNEIVSKLKGSPETQVNITFYRPQSDSLFEIPIGRGEVPLKSVNAAFSINKHTGYIKINRFAQTTHDEFIEALRMFDLYETKNLILDLRDNPGGYLYPAQQIADEFLKEGTPIVITESNKGERHFSIASEVGGYEKGGVYLLVNEQSASSAEVLAGALQDNDRAWIVGRRTFGKGLVQQQFPLGDGDEIRLTSARYFTPTGRSIQRPYSFDKESYFDDITNRFDSGEMADEAKIPINDSLAFKTPEGRTVYGGGGIYPDIYVPITDTPDEQWNTILLRSNLMNHFVFTTLDADRASHYFPEEEALIKEPLPQAKEWIQSFKKYCKDSGIPIELNDMKGIEIAIKAYIGLQLFGENCFTKILLQKDSFLDQVRMHQQMLE